jgi:hypothetical protein
VPGHRPLSNRYYDSVLVQRVKGSIDFDAYDDDVYDVYDGPMT